ncbi:MAG: hypothetical protein PWQ82_615 [Thermosediminibacterales bacterium]|nr:hypothetical protein [Thermosediminibacterales bacterium]MDK2835541.1 hypothetical protein [Thermosediminibacterales bacterium]
MRFKMLAVDLDDSLLGKDKKISKENLEAIKTAMSKGIIVTIATGRMFCSAEKFGRELDINIPLITYNGALIKETISGKILVHKPLPLNIAKKIIELVSSKNVAVNTYINDKLYVEKISEDIKNYAETYGVEAIPVGDLLEFMQHPPTKILLIGSNEEINNIQSYLKGLFGESVNLMKSQSTFLEITHPEANKGAAVARLAGIYGIKREEVIAIGDSENDLSMIEYAGLGVAMGNASENIKKQADYVTTANEESGVANVIKKFIL